MAAVKKKKRVLIFVIAYHAETTLVQVLERIPRRLFDEHHCEVLVVDDSSEDRTFQIGCEYKERHPDVPMTVLRNRYNQGYGGNQKVGYEYAISRKFDFVAMLHGDGQYAPEALPALLAPLVDGEADAVFGSRMMTRWSALKGGMPLYKFAGNRVLSVFQNTVLGTELSEFHSGYRVYSVAALRKLPFRLNTNDFHFDTEIIIQFVNAGLRIAERPIPTYYGDEICRVNGLKYAADVARVTLQNAAHRAGVLYQRRFDTVPEVPASQALKLGYPSSHTYAMEAVPDGSAVLAMGLEADAVAAELSKKGCRVTVKPDPGKKLNVDIREYDHILMLDILEHLEDPEQFLEALREGFDFTKRRMVLTTPNVAFFIPRLMLLAGQFNYGKAGILDKTHTRLFTFRSIKRLLRDTGFRVKAVRGVPAPFPKAFGDGPLARAALDLNLALIRLSPGLFAYQIYVEAETTPSVKYVLSTAER